jgi:hypothetical protein
VEDVHRLIVSTALLRNARTNPHHSESLTGIEWIGHRREFLIADHFW